MRLVFTYTETKKKNYKTPYLLISIFTYSAFIKENYQKGCSLILPLFTNSLLNPREKLIPSVPIPVFWNVVN